MRVLFIGKKDDFYSSQSEEYLKQIFSSKELITIQSSKGQKIPIDIQNWKGDYIFSYLSQWIIPKALIDNASKGAINWHPGPPEYPGIGCTNFAIYNNEKSFGITCHYMLEKVDSGKIIQVERFQVLPEDTVYSITQKCYLLMINSFMRIVEKIKSNENLPNSKESWKRTPYTRVQLNDLCRITLEMDEAEVNRRIKATTYKDPWAYVELYGRKYYLK